MNKKVISLVLSIAMIVSCFACMAGLGVYAVDNAGLGSFFAKSPVKTVSTTAEEKAASAEVPTSVTPFVRGTGTAYPTFDASDATGTYPRWHCRCGNVWADVTHNNDTVAPSTDLNYLYGSADKCKKEGDYGCDGELIYWSPLTAVSSIMTGNYYLTADISTNVGIGIGATTPAGTTTGIARKELCIDFNGFNYTNTGSARLFTTLGRPDSHVSLTDTRGTSIISCVNGDTYKGMLGWIPTSNTNKDKLSTDIACGTTSSADYYGGTYLAKNNSNGAAFDVYRSGAITLFDGVTIDASAYTSTNTGAGGLINMGNSGTATDHTVFNVFGATIKGYTTKTSGAGGLIYLYKYGELNVKNATLVGTNLTNTGANGGTIAVGGEKSILNIDNSTISGGKGGKGGNIMTAAVICDITITNSDILDGEATSTTGGNIHVLGKENNVSNITITNCTIAGGKAKTNGGNINIGEYTKANFDKVNILNGDAKAEGGNIWSGGAGTQVVFAKSGNVSNIYNGTAGTLGGNCYFAGSSSQAYLLRRVNVYDGYAKVQGGNIWTNANGGQLSGGRVYGGSTDAGEGSGEDIYVHGGVLKLYDYGGGATIDGEVFISGAERTTTQTHIFSGDVNIGKLIVAAPHAETTANTGYDNKFNIALTSGADIKLFVEAEAPYLSFAGEEFADEEAALCRNLFTNATDAELAYITPLNTGYELVQEEGIGHLAKSAHKHAVTGANTANTRVTHAAKLSSVITAAQLDGDIVYEVPVSSAAELQEKMDEFATNALAKGEKDYYQYNVYLTDNITLTEDQVNTVGSTDVYGFLTTKAFSAQNTNRQNCAFNICLNGFTITAANTEAATNNSLFWVQRNSILSITDCKSTGKLVSPRTETSSGEGLFRIGNNARVFLSGIDVEGGSSTEGAIINNATARFYAADTTFTGMHATGSDATAAAFTAVGSSASYSRIELYGCDITPAEGGPIAVSSTITTANRGVALVVDDCTITNNTSARAVYYNNSHANTQATFTDTTITSTSTANSCFANARGNVALNGCTISSTDRAAYANGNANTSATFTNCAFSSTNFRGVDNQGTIVMTGGTVTGGAVAFSNNGASADSTLTNVTVTSDNNRCFTNGGTNKTASQLTLINCTTNPGQTPIEDTINEETGKSNDDGFNIGGAILNYAQLDINGGTINGAPVQRNGGVLYTTGEEAETNIFGDAILQNGSVVASNGNGGNIYVTGGATVNIYGNAQVKDGNSVNDGGNIMVQANSTVNVYGDAKVTGGTAHRGGNFYVYGVKATANFSGYAEISGGTASNLDSNSGGQGNGGNVYCSGGNDEDGRALLTITENAVVKNGTATNVGGNLYLNADTTINGGSIEGGHAVSNGGSVFFTGTGTQSIANTSITGGTSDKCGGNIYVNQDGMTIPSTVTVSGGTALYGGNIGVGTGKTLTVQADVADGTATYGKAIFVYINFDNDAPTSGAKLIVDGASVGEVGVVYPFTSAETINEGSWTKLNMYTLSGGKFGETKRIILSTEDEAQAFNNWYLLTRGQTKDDGQKFIRFFALVDGQIENYKVAGFTVNYQGENIDLATHDIYSTNFVAGEELPIASYSLESDYYFRNEMTIDQDKIDSGATFTVTAYLEDNDGNVITGPTATVDLSKITFYKAPANEG